MAKKGQDTTCPVCKIVFYQYQSQIKRGRVTCSRTCAARLFRDKGTTEQCKRCGKDFYRLKSRAERGYGNFCSTACWASDRSNQVECTCIQCEAVFKREHHAVTKAGGGKFCSRACTDIFKRKLRKRGELNMFTGWQKREWMIDACQRCGTTERLELDHIHPRFAGGLATKDNAQTLCSICNRKKFWTDDYPIYRQLLTQRVAAEC